MSVSQTDGLVRCTVETTGPGRVRLRIEVPFGDLVLALREACGQDEGGDGPGRAAPLAGFRGRLPFRAIDRRAGATVLPQAVQEAVLDLVLAATWEQDVLPLGRPEVEIVESGPDRPLRFTADIDTRTPVTLPPLGSITVAAGPIGADTGDQSVRGRQVERFTAVRTEVLAQLAAAADVSTPHSMVEDEVEHRKQWMVSELAQHSMTLADYLDAAHTTEAAIDAQLRRATAERIRSQLVLDAVADEENIQVSEDEIAQTLDVQAQRASVASRDYARMLAHNGATDSVRTDIRRAKALAALLRKVVLTDAEGNRITLEDLHTPDAAQP
ncbi:MAG TPA: trigger factor [Actinocrinis sp.]|nr:trigger factor [Actinocrinis sp.]